MASAFGGMLREPWPVKPWSEGYRTTPSGVSALRFGIRRNPAGWLCAPDVPLPARVCAQTVAGTSAQANALCCRPRFVKGGCVPRAGLRRVVC